MWCGQVRCSEVQVAGWLFTANNTFREGTKTFPQGHTISKYTSI